MQWSPWPLVLAVSTITWLGFGPVAVTRAYDQGAAGNNPPSSVGNSFVVDRVWAGTRVNFDAVVSGSEAFVAYYDSDRWLTAARIDLQTGKIERRRLKSRFGGWDGHNHITIEHDAKGYLHVAGNMHTSPMVYARTLVAGDFGSLTLLNKMVGVEEQSVTYPRFFLLPGGALGFSYRSGRSGAGHEFINRFDGSNWDRWVTSPLFSYDSEQDKVNAYHTGYVQGPDGAYYTAWVWRRNSRAETNFDVCFAKSFDLKSWYDSQGRKLVLPITPSRAEVVERIPPSHGLFNNVKLGFDTAGRPVISYLKFDHRGHTQLYHARREETGWRVTQASSWEYRWDFRGKGTLVAEISFSGITANNGQLEEKVRHSKYGDSLIVYDPATLERKSILSHSPVLISTGSPIDRPDPFVTVKRPARLAGNTGTGRYEIRWKALPADNNDKPRSCESVRLASGCRFISELHFHAGAD